MRQVLIAEVDCTQSLPLCQANGVKGFPTLLAFKGGEDAIKYQGGRTLEQFDRYVQQHLLERPCDPEFDFDSDGINDCGGGIPPRKAENIPKPAKENEIAQRGSDITSGSPTAMGTEFLLSRPYAVPREGKTRVAEFREQVRKATEWWMAMEVDAVDLVAQGFKGVKKLGEALSIAVPLVMYATTPEVGVAYKLPLRENVNALNRISIEAFLSNRPSGTTSGYPGDSEACGADEQAKVGTVCVHADLSSNRLFLYRYHPVIAVALCPLHRDASWQTAKIIPAVFCPCCAFCSRSHQLCPNHHIFVQIFLVPTHLH